MQTIEDKLRHREEVGMTVNNWSHESDISSYQYQRIYALDLLFVALWFLLGGDEAKGTRGHTGLHGEARHCRGDCAECPATEYPEPDAGGGSGERKWTTKESTTKVSSSIETSLALMRTKNNRHYSLLRSLCNISFNCSIQIVLEVSGCHSL